MLHSSLERRLALIHEGAHPFRIILRPAGLALQVALRSSCTSSVLVDEALSASFVSASPCVAPSAKRVQSVCASPISTSSSTHFQMSASLPRSRPAPVRQGTPWRALALPHEPRQEEGAACIGNEADAGEGLEEARRAAREHDVAGERDVGAGACRHAVHRADDRHRQGAQLLHQRRILGLDGAAEIGRL